MTLWIVTAAPIGKTARRIVEAAEFVTDTAAKSHVRSLVRMNYAVRVQSAPGHIPALAMTHAQSTRWALE